VKVHILKIVFPVGFCDSPQQSRTAVSAVDIQQKIVVNDLSLVADIFLGLINAQNSLIAYFPNIHIKYTFPRKS
jgi:hypothetical protein